MYRASVVGIENFQYQTAGTSSSAAKLSYHCLGLARNNIEISI